MICDMDSISGSPWPCNHRIVQNFDGGRGNFDDFDAFQLDWQNLTRQIV